MRASMALDPKSHCDSRTPITGDAQSSAMRPKKLRRLRQDANEVQ
jgi:hypothetical protein